MSRQRDSADDRASLLANEHVSSATPYYPSVTYGRYTPSHARSSSSNGAYSPSTQLTSYNSSNNNYNNNNNQTQLYPSLPPTSYTPTLSPLSFQPQNNRPQSAMPSFNSNAFSSSSPSPSPSASPAPTVYPELSATPLPSAPEITPLSPPIVSSSHVKVNFRTLSGQVMTVSFPSLIGVTVWNLKQKLEEEHNIPTAFQRLIFGGKEMMDSEPCVNYGVENDSMVHMLLKTNRTGNGSPDIQSAAAVSDAVPVTIPAPVSSETVSTEVHERLNKTLQLGKILKLFALIDIVICFFWAISVAPPYAPLFATGVLLSMGGYYGAHGYKVPFILGYMFFKVCSLTVRSLLIADPTIFNKSDSDSNNTIEPIFLILGIVIDIYLLKLTNMFYQLIKQLSVTDRQELLILTNPNAVLAGNASYV